MTEVETAEEVEASAEAEVVEDSAAAIVVAVVLEEAEAVEDSVEATEIVVVAEEVLEVAVEVVPCEEAVAAVETVIVPTKQQQEQTNKTRYATARVRLSPLSIFFGPGYILFVSIIFS